MTLTDKLSMIKGKYHKSMIENVTMLLTGLLTSKTTNLYKMKDDMARITGLKGLKSIMYPDFRTEFISGDLLSLS